MVAIVPIGGYAGWRFLSANLDAQVQRMAESPLQARDREYFRENIGNVVTASQLVEDYRLRRVALSAFGLQDDLPNRAFIERVLGDGTGDATDLSNRLSDKRYRAFSEAFGFGSTLAPRTLSPGFADRILARFDRQEFERSVGEQDEDLRLALTASRELPELAARDLQDTTAWLSVLGNPPLRRVFETALGLPASIGTLDLDRQVDEFREAADRILGFRDISRFADGAATEELVKNFTLRAQLASGPSPTVPGLAASRFCRQACSAGARQSRDPCSANPSISASLAKLASIDPAEPVATKASRSSQRATAASVVGSEP
jgi:hypothetical protein